MLPVKGVCYIIVEMIKYITKGYIFKVMKRNILPVLILCVILALGACAAPETVKTAAGEFETSQDTMATINDGHGNALAASLGIRFSSFI